MPYSSNFYFYYSLSDWFRYLLHCQLCLHHQLQNIFSGLVCSQIMKKGFQQSFPEFCRQVWVERTCRFCRRSGSATAGTRTQICHSCRAELWRGRGIGILWTLVEFSAGDQWTQQLLAMGSRRTGRGINYCWEFTITDGRTFSTMCRKEHVHLPAGR